jgi:hypothetical protein
VTERDHLPDRTAPETSDVDGYDAAADMCESITFAYAFIRARAARGGRGWGGWPSAEAPPAIQTPRRPGAHLNQRRER